MTMWPKLKPLLILLSVALNVAFVSVWAFRVLPQGLGLAATDASRPGCMEYTLSRELGASEMQRQQLEPRQAAYRESTWVLCRRAQELRGELIDLIALPSPDGVALAAKQDSILAIQRRMQALVVQHLLAEKQVLNAEQQKKLFSIMRLRCGCGNGAGGCMNPEMRSLPTSP